MKEFWNERFAKEEYVYGTEPNSFLKSELEKINIKGNALFPMEGEGRNACHTAQKGWNVDAFDFSESGKEKALKLCKLNNVSITYELSKVEDYQFEFEKYDLVALIYAHVAPESRVKLHRNIINSLKPGGIVILEAFHPKQLNDQYTSGGPKNKDLLYDLDSIKNDFKDLSEIHSEELEIDLTEGDFHQGKGFVTRFIGVK
ncbi:MAG: methyltransferase domain-containing protein [Psychroflexus sp.]